MQIRDNLMTDAIFEGGGVKGIGLVSAITVAEEKPPPEVRPLALWVGVL